MKNFLFLIILAGLSINANAEGPVKRRLSQWIRPTYTKNYNSWKNPTWEMRKRGDKAFNNYQRRVHGDWGRRPRPCYQWN